MDAGAFNSLVKNLLIKGHRNYLETSKFVKKYGLSPTPHHHNPFFWLLIYSNF